MSYPDLSSTDDPPHEERLSTRRAYDGHILHVRVDDVRLPSGRETVREMIEHPGSVIVLPVTTAGEVVFVRQGRYTIGRTVTELPAGLIDEGDEPEEAAARELEEETGYRAGRLHFLVAAWVSPGYTQERSHIYVATGCERIAHQPDEDEPMKLVRVPVGDLPEILQAGQCPIENVQALLALNWFVRVQDDLLGDT